MIKLAYLPMGMVVGKSEDPNKNGGVVFKDPRVVQVLDNKSGVIQFQMGFLFGQPSFVEIPPGTIIGDVQEKNVLDSYARATSSLVLAGEMPANVRQFRGN